VRLVGAAATRACGLAAAWKGHFDSVVMASPVLSVSGVDVSQFRNHLTIEQSNCIYSIDSFLHDGMT
jgi:hypothetical protein